MSLLDAGKVCLFSNISGVILMDGKPAANALVKRKVEFSGTQEDETRTDDNGHFELPVIFDRTLTKHLPQEFTVGQEIIVTYKNKEYSIWSGVKRKYDENSESRGKPLVVTCELNSERKFVQVNNQPIFSLCTWDVKPDEIDTGF